MRRDTAIHCWNAYSFDNVLPSRDRIAIFHNIIPASVHLHYRLRVCHFPAATFHGFSCVYSATAGYQNSISCDTSLILLSVLHITAVWHMDDMPYVLHDVTPIPRSLRFSAVIVSATGLTFRAIVLFFVTPSIWFNVWRMMPVLRLTTCSVPSIFFLTYFLGFICWV